MQPARLDIIQRLDHRLAQVVLQARIQALQRNQAAQVAQRVFIHLQLEPHYAAIVQPATTLVMDQQDVYLALLDTAALGPSH